MPALEYFIVADSVSVDRDTNQVSIFGVLDEYHTPIPGTIPRAVAVSSWNLTAGDRNTDFQVTLKIRCPGGDASQSPPDFSVNFTAERTRHRIMQYLFALPVPCAGDLVFEILLNGEHKASHVVTIQPPAEETA